MNLSYCADQAREIWKSCSQGPTVSNEIGCTDGNDLHIPQGTVVSAALTGLTLTLTPMKYCHIPAVCLSSYNYR